MNRTKSRLLALILVAMFICAAVPFASTPSFTDVPTSHWAFNQIEKAATDGIMTGTAPGVFSPNDKLTVVQWMVILTRTYYGDEVAASTATGEWYAQNYAVATNHRLMSNVFQDEYIDSLMPVTMTKELANKECSREQAAAMLYNVMKDKSMAIPSAGDISATQAKIHDLSSCERYRHESIAVCYYYGILTGVDAAGNFGGENSMTRAQAAVLYCRMEEALSKGGNTGNTGTPVVPDKPENPTTPDEPDKPVASGKTLPNGKEYTDANVKEYIDTVIKKKYPEGWTYDAQTRYYSFAFNANGLECAKLAFMVSDDIFGTLPAHTHKDITKIRPGDVLEHPGHWSIATSTVTPDLYDAGCYNVDAIDGGPAGIANWSSGKLLNSNAGYTIWTRYPD